MGYVVCKYFLPFHRLHFQFINDFLCWRFLTWCNLTCCFLVLLPLLFGDKSKKSLPRPMSRSLSPMFSSRNFTISHLTFKYLFPSELIFVYDVRKGFSFIPLHFATQFSQSHLLKRLTFPHYVFSAPLSKFKYVWVYFWALDSVPFVYVSVFMPVLIQCCFDYYSFVI